MDGRGHQAGETFSLNGHTGERGYAQGYKDAPVILDGKLVPGVGGGVSQFTTTLFNAIYYAGLEDVEHKPHSYWFSRYPSVIESTIFYPHWTSSSATTARTASCIDTSYNDSSITVTIWSTKVYDSVKTEYGPEAQHHQPADRAPRGRPLLHLHQRHPGLHPGRVASSRQGRQGGQAGEVQLDVRRRAPLHLPPQELNRVRRRTGPPDAVSGGPVLSVPTLRCRCPGADAGGRSGTGRQGRASARPARTPSASRSAP